MMSSRAGFEGVRKFLWVLRILLRAIGDTHQRTGFLSYSPGDKNQISAERKNSARWKLAIKMQSSLRCLDASSRYVTTVSVEKEMCLSQLPQEDELVPNRVQERDDIFHLVLKHLPKHRFIHEMKHVQRTHKGNKTNGLLGQVVFYVQVSFLNTYFSDNLFKGNEKWGLYKYIDRCFSIQVVAITSLTVFDIVCLKPGEYFNIE